MKLKPCYMKLWVIIFILTLTPVSCKSSDKTDAATSDKTDAATSDSVGIKWYDYKEGIDLGKNKKKKMFINFYADWCGYCKVMDRETFKDKSVISYLNENFIAIRVNADKERKTAATYNVSSLPATWFLTEDGEKLTNLAGYVPAKKMISILKFVYTESYKKMKYSEFVKNM